MLLRPHVNYTINTISLVLTFVGELGTKLKAHKLQQPYSFPLARVMAILNRMMLDELHCDLTFETNTNNNQSYDTTPLNFTVLMQDIPLIQALLDKKCDPNLSTDCSLHTAVILNNTDIVKLLLEHGADVNKSVKVERCLAINLLASSLNENTRNFLASASKEDQLTPLKAALLLSNFKMAKLLRDAGAQEKTEIATHVATVAASSISDNKTNQAPQVVNEASLALREKNKQEQLAREKANKLVRAMQRKKSKRPDPRSEPPIDSAGDRQPTVVAPPSLSPDPMDRAPSVLVQTELKPKEVALNVSEATTTIQSHKPSATSTKNQVNPFADKANSGSTAQAGVAKAHKSAAAATCAPKKPWRDTNPKTRISTYVPPKVAPDHKGASTAVAITTAMPTLTESKQANELAPVFYVKFPPEFIEANNKVKNIRECHLRGSAAAYLVQAHLYKSPEVPPQFRDFDYIGLQANKESLLAAGFNQKEQMQTSFVCKRQEESKLPIDYCHQTETLNLLELGRNVDFTFSAIFIRVIDGAVFDPTGRAVDDIAKNFLDTLNDPAETLNKDSVSFLRAMKMISNGLIVSERLFIQLLSWRIPSSGSNRAKYSSRLNSLNSWMIHDDFKLIIRMVAQGFSIYDFAANYLVTQPQRIPGFITPTLAVAVAQHILNHPFSRLYNSAQSVQKLMLTELIHFFMAFNQNYSQKMATFNSASWAELKQIINHEQYLKLFKQYTALSHEVPSTEYVFVIGLMQTIYPSFTFMFRSWQLNTLVTLKDHLTNPDNHCDFKELQAIFQYHQSLRDFYLLVRRVLQVEQDTYYENNIVFLINEISKQINKLQLERSPLTSSASAALFSQKPLLMNQPMSLRLRTLHGSYKQFAASSQIQSTSAQTLIKGLNGILDALATYAINPETADEAIGIHQLSAACHQLISQMSENPQLQQEQVIAAQESLELARSLQVVAAQGFSP